MPETIKLPRDVSLPRLRSQFNRTMRLVRKANVQAKGNPNRATKARRTDRILAARALSFKLAFVRYYNGTTHRGSVKLAGMRKRARAYRNALRRWKDYYYGSGEHAA